METNIESLRQATFDDLMGKVQLFHKCALIRPCSFGKTVMAVKLFEKYRKVLFLYPADCIRLMLEARHENQIHKNITFMTYNMLARLNEEQIANLPDYDLVFADEAHRLGGEKTKTSFFVLLNSQGESTHFIGSTATPYRMDGFDFIHEFMDDIQVYPYTLHDAIRDGIIKKPFYYFCSLNPRKDLKNAIKDRYKAEFKHNISKEELEIIMSCNIVEQYNIFSVDNIIRDSCTKYASNTNYMKFICFFLHIEDIKKRYKMIANWFKKAFPNHKIRKTEIHSGSGANNINILESLKEEDNTIDLIYTCDMLNEGYHVGNITGIVMLRHTSSNRIYNQQIGRCLSTSESDEPKLIFDVVDNLHRPSIFGEGKTLIDIDIDTGNDDNDSDNGGNNTGGSTSGGHGDKDNNDNILNGPEYINPDDWYFEGKEDMNASFTRAMYEELAWKTLLERYNDAIEGALNEYIKRGFPSFKDRKELTKKSPAKRALFFIAKAHNLSIEFMYAAFESRFSEIN